MRGSKGYLLRCGFAVADRTPMIRGGHRTLSIPFERGIYFAPSPGRCYPVRTPLRTTRYLALCTTMSQTASDSRCELLSSLALNAFNPPIRKRVLRVDHLVSPGAMHACCPWGDAFLPGRQARSWRLYHCCAVGVPKGLIALTNSLRV